MTSPFLDQENPEYEGKTYVRDTVLGCFLECRREREKQSGQRGLMRFSMR